ncbi:MAG: nucleotidyltransferase family protein [Candidatus Rifleibacteriota bacterium]
MNSCEKICISPSASILETLKVIDDAALEIALVIDTDGKLIGTVTDGDIRRGIIRGSSLNDRISELMNRHPIVADHATTDDELLFIMTNRSIKHLPIVDRERRVIRLATIKELIAARPRPNPALIMAGGLGSRLGELTRNLPKPLLPVGGKPIISIIVEQLRRHGFTRIFISVNYQAEKIVRHFELNPVAGAEIEYLHEKQFLGTAGALTLLPTPIQEPILVMNGDILSPVNFSNLLQYHQSAGKPMTVCTREFNFQIPYGVVNMRGDQLIDIEEKPSQSIFINAGIYVLDPTLLSLVPRETRFDMPELIKTAVTEKAGVSCYPVSEFWLDIGNPNDYFKVRDDGAPNE